MRDVVMQDTDTSEAVVVTASTRGVVQNETAARVRGGSAQGDGR
jgi:hypothetical protein